MIALFALIGILVLVTIYLIWNNSSKSSDDQSQPEPKKLPKSK